MTAALKIEPLLPADWPAVRAILAAGIETGLATLETELPEWVEWERSHPPPGRYVGRLGEEIVGWSTWTPVSLRCCYDGVAEVAIYVAPRHHRIGVGRTLLAHLVRASEEAGIWTLQSMILPANRASIRLHESCGFRVVGIREKIGKRNGWHDILLMERRSPVVGREEPGGEPPR